MYKSLPIFICWFIALVASAGSLFFSDVMMYTPCTLCWYQRVVMYPLVIILLVEIIKETNVAFYFAFPFSFIGLLISLFHNLLHYGIVSENISPCRLGVSCVTKYINLFGFITIPLLSFIAFSIITLILVVFLRNKNE